MPKFYPEPAYVVPSLVDAISDAHQRERHLIITLAEVER